MRNKGYYYGLTALLLASFKWESTPSRFFALYWSFRTAKCIPASEKLFLIWIMFHYFICSFIWVMNVFYQAILEVGEVLQFYDSDKRYPTWGFGARPIDGPVSHCFNMNGSSHYCEVELWSLILFFSPVLVLQYLSVSLYCRLKGSKGLWQHTQVPSLMFPLQGQHFLDLS